MFFCVTNRRLVQCKNLAFRTEEHAQSYLCPLPNRALKHLSQSRLKKFYIL